MTLLWVGLKRAGPRPGRPEGLQPDSRRHGGNLGIKNQRVVHWEEVDQGTTLGSAHSIALGAERGLGDCDPLNSHSPVSFVGQGSVSLFLFLLPLTLSPTPRSHADIRKIIITITELL